MAAPLAAPIADGWSASLVTSPGGAVLRVQRGAEDPTLEIGVVLTPAGPVLRARAAALEIESATDLVARCENFRVEASRGVDIVAGGAVRAKARSVEVEATHGSARVVAFGVSGVAPAGSAVGGLVILVSFAGFASPLVVVIAFVASLCCASSIAEFARRLPSAGSLYTYNSRGLGRIGGFLTGWMMVFGYAMFIPAGIALASAYASQLIAAEVLHVTIDQLLLFVVILAALIVGVLIGGIASWLRQTKWRRAARRLEREVANLRAEVEMLKRSNVPVDIPKAAEPVQRLQISPPVR